MSDVPYLWIFLSVATVLDTVGIFYLWRRRTSTVSGHNRHRTPALKHFRMTEAERRRQERRQPGRAASA
jgi:hypothetical protein